MRRRERVCVGLALLNPVEKLFDDGVLGLNSRVFLEAMYEDVEALRSA